MDLQDKQGGTSEFRNLEEANELILDLVPDLSLQKKLFEVAILGRFLGKRPVSKSYLRSILNGIWSKWGDWRIEELKKGVFLFRFKTPDHCRAVMARRPWNFVGDHLILKEWPADGKWDCERFAATLLWV